MELIWHVDGRRGGDLAEADLADLYAFPAGGALRANFVSTLDGAGTGHDKLTASINTAPDNAVFALQRTLCDAVLVGAGTALAEHYRRVKLTEGGAPTVVVVSNHGQLPPTLVKADPTRGEAILLTCEAAPARLLESARDALGKDNVWAVGESAVDLAAAVQRLRDAGMPRVLCEGGPTLFASVLAEGLVDEVALSLVPTLLGGELTRISHGPAFVQGLVGQHLIEAEGTILGLWRTGP